jgi:release factor glutamine methyltransferase
MFAPAVRQAVVDRLRAAGCVFAEDEAEVLLESAGTAAELEALLRRRVAGDPLEYVVGWTWFRGVRVAVDRGVFVPRRRTEWLVHEAASRVPPAGTVVDLGCGAGGIGLALAIAVPGVAVYAVDIEPAAVRCARRNLEPVGGQVFEGDLCEPLPATLSGHVDVFVANAPYVPSDAVELMPREARLFEPRRTLDGGADGLDVVRRVAEAAAAWLAPHGCLLVEVSAEQVPATREAFDRYRFTSSVSHDEDLDATVVIGDRRR